MRPLIYPAIDPGAKLSPEVFAKKLSTVCYNLQYAETIETPTGRACIGVAPVLLPYLRPGLAKHGDAVVHIYQVQFRISPDPTAKRGAVVDTDAQRGAAKYTSETIDVNGRPFTLIVPDESVSDPSL
jgi:hypothetical protein